MFPQGLGVVLAIFKNLLKFAEEGTIKSHFNARVNILFLLAPFLLFIFGDSESDSDLVVTES